LSTIRRDAPPNPRLTFVLTAGRHNRRGAGRVASARGDAPRNDGRAARRVIATIVVPGAADALVQGTLFFGGDPWRASIQEIEPPFRISGTYVAVCPAARFSSSLA